MQELEIPYQRTLADREFVRLRGFIEKELGIKMPETKRIMLESRLQKRLKALGLATFGEYVELVFSPSGMEREIVHMIDAVTTNKTDFFRESDHFDFLLNRVLRSLEPRGGLLRLWSAGCSSGQEPYSLAVVLGEYRRQDPSFHYSILATDISTRMLDAARSAIYPEQLISMLPQPLKKRYFLRSRNPQDGLVRLKPEVRRTVEFRRLNFMDSAFNIGDPFDIVFCRNVLIYFERVVQEQVLQRICACIKRGGFLFLGHSETVTGFNLPLRAVAPAVYRRM